MIAARTSAIPTPVSAAPDSTGWTCPSRACSARAASACCSSGGRPSTYSRSSGSSHGATASSTSSTEHRPVEADDGAGQLLAEGLQGALERGAGPVHLVDEDQEGQAEPLQDPDQHPGLGLDALDRRDDQHGAVEHGQRALDLGDEVGVARGVDEVDLHRPARGRQGHRRDRGADGDAAAALDRVGVGGRVAVVDATEVPGRPGLVEESFGEGGLAGVYVRQDPQVERGHGRPSVRSNGSAINPKLRRIPLLLSASRSTYVAPLFGR